MTPTARHDDRRRWTTAAAVALAAHGVAGLALLTAGAVRVAPPEEPVVLVELPPLPEAPAPTEPQPAPADAASPPPVPTQAPPLDVPPVRAPLPQQIVAVAPTPAEPVARTVAVPLAPPAAAPAPVAAAPPAGPPAADPRAKRQEADYFALVSAHLNRRKRYPAEAKKALQQGVVTVRFTVARDGSVSGIAIRRGSGHTLLDAATTELLARAAPLPRMPAAMARDSVTVSLPIEYSLKTD